MSTRPTAKLQHDILSDEVPFIYMRLYMVGRCGLLCRCPSSISITSQCLTLPYCALRPLRVLSFSPPKPPAIHPENHNTGVFHLLGNASVLALRPLMSQSPPSHLIPSYRCGSMSTYPSYLWRDRHIGSQEREPDKQSCHTYPHGREE